MAAPVASTFTAHTGNPTTSASVTLPTTAANDILILVAVNAGATTALTVSGTYTGGAFTLTGLEAAMTASWGGSWYSRCTGNHSGQTVVVGTATDSCSSAVLRITGAITSGSPLDTNTSATTLTANGMTLTGFNTVTAEGLIVFCCAADDNISESGQAAVNVTLTEAGEGNSTGGADSHVGISTGTLTTPGATGNFSGTHASALSKRIMAFSIKRVTPSLTPAALTHTRVINAPSKVSPQLIAGALTHTRAIQEPTIALGGSVGPLAALTHTRAINSPAVSPQLVPAMLSHSRVINAPSKVSPQLLPARLTHTRAIYDVTIPGGVGGGGATQQLLGQPLWEPDVETVP